LGRRENHNMADGFSGIIAQLKHQKAAIERALAALHELDDNVPEQAAPAHTPAKRHRMSPAGKRRLIAALKKRWAAKRAAASASAPAAKPAKRKGGGMTPAGRKRLAEAMRKRWAAKRRAAQAKKAGRKKVA
jgi:hypothetical protein